MVVQAAKPSMEESAEESMMDREMEGVHTVATEWWLWWEEDDNFETGVERFSWYVGIVR